MTENMHRPAASIGAAATALFESLGVLTKGSAAQTRGEPSASATQPIDAPALNVTRVGGLATFVASVGAAALALYRVPDGASDALRIAAWASTALIVSAALVAAAIIINADIRARSATASAASPTTTAATSGSATSEAAFRRAWNDVRTQLQVIAEQLPANTGLDYTRLWLRAEKSRATTMSLRPHTDQADEHQLLLAAQSEVVRLLGRLREQPSQLHAVAQIGAIVDELHREVDGLPHGST